MARLRRPRQNALDTLLKERLEGEPRQRWLNHRAVQRLPRCAQSAQLAARALGKRANLLPGIRVTTDRSQWIEGRIMNDLCFHTGWDVASA